MVPGTLATALIAAWVESDDWVLCACAPVAMATEAMMADAAMAAKSGSEELRGGRMDGIGRVKPASSCVARD